MTTDTEHLDWIEKELWRQGGGTFSVERRRGGPLICFTIASQHVYGFNLRQVIEHAAATAEGRRNAERFRSSEGRSEAEEGVPGQR